MPSSEGGVSQQILMRLDWFQTVIAEYRALAVKHRVFVRRLMWHGRPARDSGIELTTAYLCFHNFTGGTPVPLVFFEVFGADEPL
jgi:hypothetical protein